MLFRNNDLIELNFNENQKEFIKFAIIGVTGIIVNFIFLYISLFYLSKEIAVAIGIMTSMTSNYIFNRIWTFKSEDRILLEYIKYLLSVSIGGLIQYYTTLFITRILEESIGNLLTISSFITFSINVIYIGSAVGIGLGFISNFILSKKFVFISSHKENSN